MAGEKGLIDKAALIELCGAPHWCVWMSEIEDFPTVEALEVIHAEWLDGCAIHNGKEVYKSIDCSVCAGIFKIESHSREYWKEKFMFCPFCGSLMEGGNEDG